MEENSWKEKFVPVLEGKPLEEFRGRGGNLVVISPHPDDDVLGAGGVMIAAAEQGKGVFSVTVTDGRGSPRKGPAIPDQEMAALRKQESLAALKIAGVAGGFYLEKRSPELEGEGGKEAAGELKSIFDWLRPGEVFLPAPYERHKTHLRCTRLALEALRACPGLKPRVLGYSLWGNFWGGKRRVIRDITPFIRKKVEAVLAHSSQIAYKNYQQGIVGKNNSEAVFWESHEVQKAGFVEVFVDLSEFLENWDLSLADFIRRDAEEFIRIYL